MSLKWYYSNVCCGFFFAFHSNYGPILNHFRDRDIGRKSRFFHTPSAFDAPLGATGRNIVIPFGMKKTRIVSLSKSENKFEDMFSRFDRIPACARQTDGQTSCNSIVRASRGKKTMHNVVAYKTPWCMAILQLPNWRALSLQHKWTDYICICNSTLDSLDTKCGHGPVTWLHTARQLIHVPQPVALYVHSTVFSTRQVIAPITTSATISDYTLFIGV